MKSITHWLLAVVGVCTPLISVGDSLYETFGTIPDTSQVEISPDGNTVATLQKINGEIGVAFYDVSGGGAPPKATLVGSQKARQLTWASNDHVILLVSRTETVPSRRRDDTYELFRWAALSRKGAKPTYLFSGDRDFYNTTGSGSLLSIDPQHPNTILMTHHDPSNDFNDPSRFQFNVYSVNLKNGKEKRVYRGTRRTTLWTVSGDGNTAFRVDVGSDDGQYKVFSHERGSKKSKEFAVIDSSNTSHVSTLPRGQYGVGTWFVLSRQNTDTLGLWPLDLESGEIGEPIFHHTSYDLSSYILDDYDNSLIGASYIADFEEFEYFDEQLASLQKLLEKTFQDGHPGISSFSADRTKAAIRVSYADKPESFYLYDGTSGQLKQVGSAYKDLKALSISTRKPFDYVASDDVTIPGYLTLPASADGKPLPLIVMPHGGPDARDQNDFDWWAGFYAYNGYAVYQPNFRGSTGYGYEYRTSGFNEWGARMQEDVTEGALQLVADGIVDADRICIVGASYGGYAALAGVTLTPDVYACAVSVNGVSDLMQMLGDEEQYDGASSHWRSRIGNRYEDSDAITLVTPIDNVAAITAPVMLIHGKDDTVVLYSQSRAMAKALRDHNKSVDFVTLEGEDHWLSSSATRQKMLHDSLAFIEKQIGPGR